VKRIINGGDVIFQLAMLLTLIVPFVGLFFVIRAFKKRSKQLDRIEKRIEHLSKE
jgi:uncharacterized protein YoxC